ncbi:MAG: dihydroorotase [Pelotomaculum sp.]|uniref:Dihydroorotase n=1 Tax=Pelotomaculum thermopropionicum (strain DSM 13744 / JCM 10971 / SI) TaxID=370438 RepID=PYRC_PELTS|nr:RecName: Full=Dihydroorotase; Short=DHOase [Pelotomaculum thermopropionicum SI]NPV72757.1 dihydroorotase [Pelotomaculum sp.]BAF59992.1 dihydroorotase and related cyclic amidohydrolases [Pelotomaculum thermopropionicum SI]
MKLLIKGGTVVDPVAGKIEEKDVFIVDGKIARAGAHVNTAGAEVLDASGKLVVPGLIDMHVHLREPGFEARETIYTGTRAAARGGFTSVACMPNTSPVADNGAVISFIKACGLKGAVNVYPIGAITRGSKGEELAEMGDMKEAGAVAFSDDGMPVMNAGLMRRALQYAGMLGMVVISHCEDKNLSAGGVMHEGYVSTMLGLKGIPASAEEVMVARDILLAEETGSRVHIAHVSTAGSVRLIREAKARGVRVTAEVAPHHFTLTDEAVLGYDTSTKVNPPLRSAGDVAAVREGLADGTIDVIATDHAPHTEEEKDVEYDLAPFGMVGLETAVGLVWTELVAAGVLTPLQAVVKMTLNPARVLGIPKGTLEPGADADITIIDPDLSEPVDPARFASKGRNTPFRGRLLKGLPWATIVGGRVVMQDRVIR